MKLIITAYMIICLTIMAFVFLTDFEPSNGSIFGAVTFWGIMNYIKDKEE